MALRKAVIIQVWAISDGVSTVFTLDLLKDPYWVGSHTTSGVGGTIQNWDTALITDVLEVLGAESVSISGTVVTITVPLQPEGYKHEVTFHVLFDPSITAGPPVNIDVPSVSGPNGLTSAQVGDVLTCTMGNWENMQAEPHSYAYQWWNSTAEWVSNPISGATANEYMVASADNNMYVFCELTATNTVGSFEINSNLVPVGTPAELQARKRRK